METIYQSLSAQVAVSTFFMIFPVVKGFCFGIFLELSNGYFCVYHLREDTHQKVVGPLRTGVSPTLALSGSIIFYLSLGNGLKCIKK